MQSLPWPAQRSSGLGSHIFLDFSLDWDPRYRLGRKQTTVKVVIFACVIFLRASAIFDIFACF